MAYLDSHIHVYHYQESNWKCLNWDFEKLPLPDDSLNNTTNNTNISVNGTTNSNGIVSFNDINQYWDSFIDEDQWLLFQDLKVECNGNLIKNGNPVGNVFHHDKLRTELEFLKQEQI